MSTLADILHWATNRGRTLPAKASADAAVLARADDVGNLQVQSQHGRHHALARSSQYFVYRNATPGTGIASIASSGAIDDAESFMHLKNDYTSAEAKWINLDYIRLQTTAAGTNGTDVLFCCKLEPTPSATRYTSGGTSYAGSAARNPNGASTTAPSATLKVGALVTTAATSSVRILTSVVARTVITVVGDQYLFTFGSAAPQLSSMIVAGTAIANIHIPCPPVILGPSDEFLLHAGATSQSGATSFEFEIGFWVD